MARNRWGIVLLAVALAGAGCGGGGGGGGGGGTGGGALELYKDPAGVFSIQKPKGWTVITAGNCATLGVLIRDPADALGQIFYFGTVAPVYLSQAQKDLDAWYVNNGGLQLIDYLDAPVVDPLTPDHFLEMWPEIANMKKARDYLGSDFPKLEGFRVVATAPRASMLGGISGAATGETRGFFTSGGLVGEGMFLDTVVPLFPENGNPGAGTGWGFLVCGVTAAKAEFTKKVDLMRTALDTFTVSQAYVDQCVKISQQAFAAVAREGQTLSEASDILWDGWQARTHAEDITFESWDDAYMNVERVYDPASGTVYEVKSGWYEGYDPSHCQMSGLKLLQTSDPWDLWMAPTVSGSEIKC